MPPTTSLRGIFSNATRTNAIIREATRIPVRRRNKGLEHDKLRNKDSRVWDFEADLRKLLKTTTTRTTRTATTATTTTQSNGYALGSKDISPGLPNGHSPVVKFDNNHAGARFDYNFVGVEISAIPKPKTWTQSSFAQYVHDLCQSRMPHQHGKSRSHQNKISQLLKHELFTPENAIYVTTTALDTAIRFFYKLEMVPSVLGLYSYARKIDPRLANGVIDTMLRNAANKHDGHVFTTILDGALQSGFVPTEKTWTSLLMCLEESNARQIVLDHMQQNQLITAEDTHRDVAITKLEQILWRQPLLLRNIYDLESQMETEFGKNWLTIQSANALLKRLCELPATQPIVDFMDMVTAKGCQLNLDSMNLLLLRLNRCTDLGTALKVLGSFINDSSIVPNDTSYALLFGTAWKLRYANSCKILWTAACLHRRVTRDMTSRLLESLMLLSPGCTETAVQMWKWQAGRLIAGIESAYSESSNDSSKAKRRRDGIALLESDKSLYHHYPLQSILGQLSEAYELDQSWRASREYTKPVTELRNSMIKASIQRVARG